MKRWILVNPQWGYYAGAPPQGYACWTHHLECAELMTSKAEAEQAAKRWAPGLVLVQPIAVE